MADFGVNPIKNPRIPSAESIPHFWNPNRGSIRFAPSWFMERVKAFDDGKDDIRITWNPVIERWQVFYRAPRLQHPLCSGWTLLFIHRDAAGDYLPLDERLLARLAACSAKVNGTGKEYIDRIISEMERDKVKADEKWRQDTLDAAMPSYDHAQIQVSMRGKSNGSKFATYHS